MLTGRAGRGRWTIVLGILSLLLGALAACSSGGGSKSFEDDIGFQGDIFQCDVGLDATDDEKKECRGYVECLWSHAQEGEDEMTTAQFTQIVTSMFGPQETGNALGTLITADLTRAEAEALQECGVSLEGSNFG